MDKALGSDNLPVIAFSLALGGLTILILRKYQAGRTGDIIRLLLLMAALIGTAAGLVYQGKQKLVWFLLMGVAVFIRYFQDISKN